MRPPPSLRCAALVALLVAGATPAPADVLVPKKGPPVRGVVVSRSETEVVFNPHFSTNPAMTYEVVRLPADQVKRLDVDPPAEVEFFRRLRARPPGDQTALKDVARFARDAKLKAHAEMAWLLFLAEVPDDAEALAAVGGAARAAELARGNPSLDGDLVGGLRKLVLEADPAARKPIHADLLRRGLVARPEELERYHRSGRMPTGLREDVPLSMHADRYAGAVYTLYVPEKYDAALTWPLLVGLHGGGPDGKDGDEVVGSGPSAMMFYRGLAEQHGVIVACPTAQRAPWNQPVNEALVRDVIAEVRLLYHVDVDRIHLTGHSMGGYGTWALGPKMADLFATISPMAGAGDGNVKPLVDTKTPVFVYHSADDFIPVGPDRAAAKRLHDDPAQPDYRYTELDHEGHGLPDSVRAELFEFLLPRRNYDPAHKDVWPRSSFAGKVTPEEKTYLGDPLAAFEGRPVPLDERLAAVRLGGGRGVAMVDALAAEKPAGAAEGALKLLKDEKASPHGRALAARLLGLMKDAAAVPVLRKVVAAEARRETSVLAVAAARALAALPDAEAGPALAAATTAWVAYFDRHRMGESMRFSDWERGVGTLAAIVGAWADVGGAGPPDALDKGVVARVFAAAPKVETSDRVPQDPGLARAALATAVGRAYAAGKAPDARWTALLAALASDEKAKAAAAAERK
ncbi:MAG: hypothetical protein U1E39_08305 [Planctomycetota bacterium]